MIGGTIMEIKEDYCYQISKIFTVNSVTFEPDESLVTCRVDADKAIFYKKCNDSAINELPERELSSYLDSESGYEYFGTCENCGCELSELPDAGWGVGFVCGSCALELRGELDY